MRLHRLTPPAAPVLTLEEAREQIRVDRIETAPIAAEDALIEAFVQSATDELDGRDGWLGRALVTQTWRMTLDAWPAGGVIEVPLPPLQSVTSIVYVDEGGATVTLAPSAYRVITDGEPGLIEPVYGTRWPAVRRQTGPIAITFVAGYGNAAAVPEIIKQYIRHRIGQFYEHREAVIAGTIIAEVPHVRHSLENIRFRGGAS